MIEALYEIGEELVVGDTVHRRNELANTLECKNDSLKRLARYCVSIYGPDAFDNFTRLQRVVGVFDDDPIIVLWPSIERTVHNYSETQCIKTSLFPPELKGKPIRRVHDTKEYHLFLRPHKPRFSSGRVLNNGSEENTGSLQIHFNHSTHSRLGHESFYRYRDVIGDIIDCQKSSVGFDINSDEKRGMVSMGFTVPGNSETLLNARVSDEDIARKKIRKIAWLQDSQPFALKPGSKLENPYNKNMHYSFLCAADKMIKGLALAVCDISKKEARELADNFSFGFDSHNTITPYDIEEEYFKAHLDTFYYLVQKYEPYFKKGNLNDWIFSGEHRLREKISG